MQKTSRTNGHEEHWEGAARQKPNDLLRALRRIIRSVDVRSKYVARAVGLTTPQIVVLQGIRDLTDVTSSSLSAYVSLSPATVTTILDNLQARGFVSRERSQTDRRVVHPRLTEAGTEVLEAALPHMHDDFAAAFEALSDEERLETVRSFERIAGIMEDLAVRKKAHEIPQKAGSRRSPSS